MRSRFGRGFVGQSYETYVGAIGEFAVLASLQEVNWCAH